MWEEREEEDSPAPPALLAGSREEDEEEEEEEGKGEGEEGAAPCAKGAASADSIKCPISPCLRPRVDNTCALSSLLTVWVTCLDGSVDFSCSGQRGTRLHLNKLCSFGKGKAAATI